MRSLDHAVEGPAGWRVYKTGWISAIYLPDRANQHSARPEDALSLPECRWQIRQVHDGEVCCYDVLRRVGDGAGVVSRCKRRQQFCAKAPEKPMGRG